MAINSSSLNKQLKIFLSLFNLTSYATKSSTAPPPAQRNTLATFYSLQCIAVEDKGSPFIKHILNYIKVANIRALFRIRDKICLPLPIFHCTYKYLDNLINYSYKHLFRQPSTQPHNS